MLKLSKKSNLKTRMKKFEIFLQAKRRPKWAKGVIES